jgi:hypothetical protein
MISHIRANFSCFSRTGIVLEKLIAPPAAKSELQGALVNWKIHLSYSTNAKCTGYKRYALN